MYNGTFFWGHPVYNNVICIDPLSMPTTVYREDLIAITPLGQLICRAGIANSSAGQLR